MNKKSKIANFPLPLEEYKKLKINTIELEVKTPEMVLSILKEFAEKRETEQIKILDNFYLVNDLKEWRNMSVSIDWKLSKKLKMFCIENDVALRDLCANIITGYYNEGR